MLMFVELAEAVLHALQTLPFHFTVNEAGCALFAFVKRKIGHILNSSSQFFIIFELLTRHILASISSNLHS